MRALALVFVVASLLLPTTAIDFVDCPCLKDFPTNSTLLWQVERTLRAQGSEASLSNFSLHFERDGRNCTAFAPERTGNVQCLPADYGLDRCKAHDLGAVSSCNRSSGSLPGYCEMQWCYVDPDHCNVRYEKSRSFPMLDLYYSYVACGGNDMFSEDAVEAQLARVISDKVVRVSYGFQEAPYIYKDDNGKWDGVLVEFMNELVEHIGFKVEEVPISNGSLAEYGEEGANTACANDIALGLTDVCIANAWETAERLRLAHALPSWWQEHLYLVTMAAAKQSLMETMLQVFTPFSASLWAFIVGAIVLYSLLMWWVEIRHLHHGGRTSGSLAYSLYMVLLGHLAASPMYMPKTVSGRFITVAFSFFVLIIIASYTANLASFLLQEHTKGQVDSLDAAIAAGMHICSPISIIPILEARSPGISKHVSPMETWEQGFADLGHKCEAMLIPEFSYNMAVGGLYTPENPKAHCDKILVGQPVVSINSIGLSSQQFLMPLSYFMVKYRSMGDLAEILGRSEFQLPASQCGVEDVETEQLSVSSLLGTITLSGIVTVMGIFIKCCCDWPRLGGGGPDDSPAPDAASAQEAAALEDGLAKLPIEQPPQSGLRACDYASGNLAHPAPTLAVHPVASTAPRSPRQPWSARRSAAQQEAELQAVRGAMEKVLTLLSQRQGADLSAPARPPAAAEQPLAAAVRPPAAVQRPPTLLGQMVAESMDAKRLLAEMQI